MARAILFDLDGVLIHSTGAHADAFAQVFAQEGIDDFAYSPYAGWRTAEVIADVLKRRGRPVSPNVISALACEKSRLARRALESRHPVSPHFDTVVPTLAAQYRLGLASSGAQASVDSFLRWTGSRSMFGSVLTGDDVTQAKPHPEIYQRSAERLGVTAGECVVVEDAASGVEAARAAGMAVIGVMGTCGKEALLRAGAEHVVPDLLAVEGLLRDRRSDVDRARWTAVVPAAGRGSRLGYSRPKILYPLAGRLILDWLVDLLMPHCARLVFVLSVEGAERVTAELNRRIPGEFDIVIQETPTGMGDAVALALPAVGTQSVAVLWGDQAGFRPESAEQCMRLHQGPLAPMVTFPTVVRAHPYIHFDRDASGRLTDLKQAREGDAMPETGESDSGFFCFETGHLNRLLAQVRTEGGARGNSTGEFNLLPVIPLAARQGVVLTPRLRFPEEAIGVNDRRDAAAAEEFLESLHGR